MFVGKSWGASNDTKYALAVPATIKRMAAMINFFFILVFIPCYAKTNVILWASFATSHTGSYILQSAYFERY